MSLADETRTHLLAHHRDFAAFADTMVRTHQGRFDPVFWAFLEQLGPEQVSTILDLGTGPGLLLLDLEQRFPEANVIGVDGQPDMLRRARQHVAGHERIQLVDHDLATAGEIPGVPAGSVDLCISSVVIHELQVPTTALDAAASALRPGGVLIIYDWVRRSLASYFDGERPHSLDQFTHFSEHCRYTAEDLAWLIERSGFEVNEHMGRRGGDFLLLAASRTSP